MDQYYRCLMTHDRPHPTSHYSGDSQKSQEPASLGNWAGSPLRSELLRVAGLTDLSAPALTLVTCLTCPPKCGGHGTQAPRH